jgi:two-component system, LuxR family, sensor kinase FixL
MTIPLPDNELQRLEALFRFKILDTEDDEVYDTIVQLAASIMETPSAFLSFIDTDRAFVKARVGSQNREGSRELSFCAHTILDISGPTLVRNATLDTRFADNPYVVGDPKIRFYFGIPLVTSNQEAIGTICVIDSVPRKDPTPFQIESIGSLAKLVMAQLELREFIFEIYDKFQQLKVFNTGTSEVIKIYSQLNENCDSILKKIKSRKRNLK